MSIRISLSLKTASLNPSKILSEFILFSLYEFNCVAKTLLKCLSWFNASNSSIFLNSSKNLFLIESKKLIAFSSGNDEWLNVKNVNSFEFI